MSTVTVHEGDCLTVLRTLPDSSCHSLVTDPPAGIAFMGRKWDGNRGGRDQWVSWLAERMTEAYRVLKPGAHALVWALPRTSHWTALALEDAGFDIQSWIVHLFGSGFPKSLDVSKAIDRMVGADRSIVRVPTRAGNSERRGLGEQGSTYGDAHGGYTTLSEPVTDTARQWDGWGTALKPSAELWWLVRKPFPGTVAANVLEHGTGALNIEGCRVAASGRPLREVNPLRADVNYAGSSLEGRVDGSSASSRAVGTTDMGRWPPNTVLSHSPLLDHDTGEVIGDACADGCVEGCPVRELDNQSGILSNCGGPKTTNHTAGMFGLGQPGAIYADSGGASRFFPTFRYQAKAPSSERPKVNGKAHPTVKSLTLMRWLVALITPPEGTVLDCFAGTGTTGAACLFGSFNAILIDDDPESVAYMRKRFDPAEPSMFDTVIFEEERPAKEGADPVEEQDPVEPEPDLFDLLDEMEG